MEAHSVLQDHNELRDRAVASIRKLAEIAEEDGSTVTHQNRTVTRTALLKDIGDKLAKNEFVLAVVGEFSRGKSSLINTLLEDPSLLPTSIEPSTAAITVLSYGPERSISATFTDGTSVDNLTQDQLSKYVLGQDLDGSARRAEITRRAVDAQRAGRVEDLSVEEIGKSGVGAKSDHGNVKTVNVHLPSPFLHDGICLVDTPGIGSVNPEHGEATRGFIHRADAVIFLINTDPVISQSECNFLAFLKDYVNRFLFVVTKIDRFNERERQQSVAYTASTIEKYAGIPEPPMFPVSAKLATEARAENNEEKMSASGFPAFLHELEVFLIRARGQEFIKELVNDSLTHLADLRNSTSVELQGLELSAEDLQKKIMATRPALERAHARGEQILEDLERKMRSIERSMGALGGVDDLRLYYALRDEVSAEVDNYDWNQLQHASETLPIFVRDSLQKSVQERLDSISQRVVEMREEVSNATRGLVGEMNEEVAAQFEALRLPHQLGLSFQYDPAAFTADLQRVGTITIGSTFLLSVASILAIGGPVGAVVLVGGLLARHTITSVFRNRVKEELKKTLDPALNTLIQELFTNIKSQVDKSMNEFREEIEGLLQSAISNVENTLERLEKERQSAEFNSGERQERLQKRKAALEELEAELSLIVGPGW